MPSKRRRSRIFWDLCVIAALVAFVGAVMAPLTHSRTLFNAVMASVGGLLLLAFVVHHVRNSRSNGSSSNGSPGKFRLSKPWSKKRRILFTLAVCFAIVFGALTLAGSGASWPGGDSGGVSCNPPYPMPQDQINPPKGHRTCDVWHNGYAPAGGYLAYGFHLIVDVGYNALDYAKPRFTSINVRIHYTKDRESVDYRGLISDESVTKYYACRVGGKYVKKGCIYIYRKALVDHLPVGFVKLITAKPAVAIKMNAAGELLGWWWNDSIF